MSLCYESLGYELNPCALTSWFRKFDHSLLNAWLWKSMSLKSPRLSLSKSAPPLRFAYSAFPPFESQGRPAFKQTLVYLLCVCARAHAYGGGSVEGHAVCGAHASQMSMAVAVWTLEGPWATLELCQGKGAKVTWAQPK